MGDKYFCYLDILGFSNRVMDNSTEFAFDLLINYNTVLRDKFLEEKIHPANKHSDKKLREISERNSVSSFKEFIAQSDSIFIVSDDANIFIEQISSFLCDSFDFNSNAFLNMKDSHCPEKVDYTVFDAQGKIYKQERMDYPLIARGAVSYGEVIIGTTPYIHNGELSSIATCGGKAVVNAIKMAEIHGYGPYLFIDENFFEKLSDDEKRYVGEIDNRKYFLWPICFITDRENYEIAKMNEIRTTLIKASNLFKAYSNSKVAKYYRDFLELCIHSFKALFNNEQINSDLKEIILEQNVNYSMFETTK